MRIPEPVGVYESIEEAQIFNSFANNYVYKGSWLFVRKVLKYCSVHGEVLDVGVGGGQLAVLLARSSKKPMVTGLDSSMNMLALARERSLNEGMGERMRFVQADASGGLSFEDNTFDVVTCHLVLHEIIDTEVFIKELKRVVKPGGAILIKDIIRPPQVVFWILPWRLFSLNARMARQSYNSWRAALSYRELRKVKAFLGSNYCLRWIFFWASIYPK